MHIIVLLDYDSDFVTPQSDANQGKEQVSVMLHFLLVSNNMGMRKYSARTTFISLVHSFMCKRICLFYSKS